MELVRRPGPGRPALVVPGAFSDERSMAPLADALATHGYDVAVLRTSTRGRRVPQLDPGGLSALDDDVDAALRELDDDPLVVGHSMGGRLTTRLLRRRSLPAAVLLQPVPPGGLLPWVARRSLRAPLELLKMAALGVTPLAPRLLPGSPPAGLYGRRVAAAARDEATAAVVAEGWRSLAETLLPDDAGRGPVDDTPVLVVAGDEDGIVPAAAAAAAAEELGAELWTWTAGHALTLEPDHADRVADLVDWCSAVGAGP